MPLKAQATKEKNRLHEKLKTCMSEDTIKQMESQPTEREKVCKSYT